MWGSGVVVGHRRWFLGSVRRWVARYSDGFRSVRGVLSVSVMVYLFVGVLGSLVMGMTVGTLFLAWSLATVGAVGEKVYCVRACNG